VAKLPTVSSALNQFAEAFSERAVGSSEKHNSFKEKYTNAD